MSNNNDALREALMKLKAAQTAHPRAVTVLVEEAHDLLEIALAASKTEQQEQAGEPLTELAKQLCVFYGVNNYAELVAAQDRHIAKLQAKVTPLIDEQPGKARFA